MIIIIIDITSVTGTRYPAKAELKALVLLVAVTITIRCLCRSNGIVNTSKIVLRI
jgi:hypothetical protein